MSTFAVVDKITGILKSVGLTSQDPGDTSLPVEGLFLLKPGQWRWDGAVFVRYSAKREVLRGKISLIPAGPIREAFDALLNMWG